MSLAFSPRLPTSLRGLDLRCVFSVALGQKRREISWERLIMWLLCYRAGSSEASGVLFMLFWLNLNSSEWLHQKTQSAFTLDGFSAVRDAAEWLAWGLYHKEQSSTGRMDQMELSKSPLLSPSVNNSTWVA